MDRNALRTLLLERIGDRLDRIGIGRAGAEDDLDLLRSGVLDSLAFVDMVVILMDASGKEIDLERALDRPGSTTVGGLIELFTTP